jgi:hypothetical protein
MVFKLHKKRKLDIIAHSLTSSGVTIWYGIPEKIIADLKSNGYKIKKSKSFKNILQKNLNTLPNQDQF